MHLKPSQIFFSQNSICNRFGKWCQHRETYIGETLDDICNGRCSIENIPRMKVVKKDNKWFTLDNRRLWVFRQLERLGKCTEIEVKVGTYIPSSKFTTANGGVDITIWRGRSPCGNWIYKPSVIQLNITSEAEPVTPSASSSTYGDIMEQKNTAIDEPIEPNAYTNTYDKKDITHIPKKDFDDKGMTEPSKSAKDQAHDKTSFDSSMPAHISRQTGTTYFGNSHTTKRKRPNSPQAGHHERNVSRGTGTGCVPLNQQDDHPKRACLYPTYRQHRVSNDNFQTSAAPRTSERAFPTLPVSRFQFIDGTLKGVVDECEVKTLQRNSLLPIHPLSIVSSGSSDGQGVSESNVAETLLSTRPSDSTETHASQTAYRSLLRRRPEKNVDFPRRSRRLKHLPPLPL